MKKALRAIGFIVLSFILLFAVSQAIIIGSGQTVNKNSFYNLEKDSVDVIFVGSSHCYCGFIPEKLYENQGLSGYILASSNQSMLANYLWAKEAYRTQKYKVLVVEAMSFPMSHGDVENDIRSLNSMKMSQNYYEMATVYKREAYKLIFPVFAFHSYWENIDINNYKSAIQGEESSMRGYVPLYTVAGEENTIKLIDENNTSTDYLNFTYFDKIIDFCDENGIKLIVVKTAMANNEVNRWDTEYNNTVKEYCNMKGIPFYDFNEQSIAETAGVNPAEDVAADGRHLNYNGAQKTTDFIGEIIMNY